MRSCRLARIAPALVILALGSCTPFKDDDRSVDAGDGEPGRDAESGGQADAGGCDAPPWGNDAGGEAGSRCDPRGAFAVPQLVPGLATIMAQSVSGLRLSPDYRTGYFNAHLGDAGGFYDLYVASRPTTASAFGCVAPVAGKGIETSLDEMAPTLSGDGLTLVFGRAYPGELPVRLYTAGRPNTASDFGDAGLVAGLNDLAASDQDPFLREDGRVLYFASTRNLNHQLDIYRATWNGTTFDIPTAVAELDTSFNEGAPVVTPDDLTIYYATDAPSGLQYDIWMATRASTRDPFGAAHPVAEVNTMAADAPTFVTRDGCTLYLTSDVTVGFSLMYVATRSASP